VTVPATVSLLAELNASEPGNSGITESSRFQ
jgi:hypothetical protein